MADVDEIRRTLKRVMKERGTGAIALANELGLGRTYISDFISGKKRSLGITEATAIADELEIPLKELTPEREKPPAIRKGARPHLYITEHMELRALDDEAVSRRTDGIAPAAIASWRASPAKMQDWQVAAILHALDMDDIAELARPPAPARRKPETAPRKKMRRSA